MTSSILAKTMVLLIQQHLVKNFSGLEKRLQLNCGMLETNLTKYINMLTLYCILDPSKNTTSNEPNQNTIIPLRHFSNTNEGLRLLESSNEELSAHEEVLRFLGTLIYKLQNQTAQDVFFNIKESFQTNTPMTAGLLCALSFRLAAMLSPQSDDTLYNLKAYCSLYNAIFKDNAISLQDFSRWQNRCFQLLDLVHFSAESNFGDSPLMKYVRANKRMTLRKALYSKEGDPAELSEDGLASIHLAATLGYFKVIEELVNFNKNQIALKDANKKTALDHVNENKRNYSTDDYEAAQVLLTDTNSPPSYKATLLNYYEEIAQYDTSPRSKQLSEPKDSPRTTHPHRKHSSSTCKII